VSLPIHYNLHQVYMYTLCVIKSYHDGLHSSYRCEQVNTPYIISTCQKYLNDMYCHVKLSLFVIIVKFSEKILFLLCKQWYICSDYIFS